MADTEMTPAAEAPKTVATETVPEVKQTETVEKETVPDVKQTETVEKVTVPDVKQTETVEKVTVPDVKQTETVEKETVPDVKQTETVATEAEKISEASPKKDAVIAKNGDAKEEQNGHSNEETTENSKDDKVADSELPKKIVTQIEYYFGNFNLPRDKFLSSEVKKDDGWVPLTTMLKFARLAKLTLDASAIVAAIKDSPDTFMQVDSSDSKIRRSVEVPLPELSEGLREESVKRTVYCKGFPKDGTITLDVLLEYFKPHGEVDSIRIRTYSDLATNAKGFKGSVLVVFKTIEEAQTFITRPPVQYKKTYLIRKWFGDYLEEKRKEVEERRAKKQARLDKTGTDGVPEKQEFAELGKGIFLRATGFSANTMREDIKAAVFDLTNDCAFVDFRKGDTQAYIRFTEPGSNVQILASLKDNLKVNDCAIELFMVEAEEEEEQITKGNEARKRSHNSGPYTKKRKGGFGGRGGRGRNKRQRT